MKISDMAVVETTYEKPHGEHIYRVVMHADYALVKRVPAVTPLWSHAVLTQIYDGKEAKFVPALGAGHIRLTRAEAEGVLASLGADADLLMVGITP